MTKDLWGHCYTTNPKRPPCGLALKLAKHAYRALNGESGEIDLVVTIIVHAAKDRDLTFLYGDMAEYYCDLIGLPYKGVLEVVEKVWNAESA